MSSPFIGPRSGVCPLSRGVNEPYLLTFLCLEQRVLREGVCGLVF